MLEGAAGSVLSTSYTAADHDILAAEAAYTALESDLQSRLANTEALYPGYDEYRYQADEIGHDPHQLIAFLTVRFQSFSAADVQPELEQLFTAQYNLSTREETEVHTRTEIQYDRYGRPQTVEVEYPWRILYVTLQNHTLSKATDTLLTEQEQARCSLLVQLQGNRPDLFRDSIYTPSLPEDYEIPADALADPQFAALIAEGEKFLGFLMCGEVPLPKPPSAAAGSSVGYTPTAVCTACRAPQPPVSTTSAASSRPNWRSRATSSFSPAPMTPPNR